MAGRPRKNSTPETGESADGFDGFDMSALTATPLAAPPVKPNPLAAQVAASVGDGWDANGRGLWMELPPIPAGKVTPVVAMLHNAASQANHGLATRTTKNSDGTVTIAFQSKRDRKEAKYTAQDVKDWARENYPGYDGGKASAEIRKAFRLANGYESAE